MNAQKLFPHIGKVIASTGSSHFPRLLHDLILTHLPVDATHITQFPAEPIGNLSDNLSKVSFDNKNRDTNWTSADTSPPISLTDDLLAGYNSTQRLASFATCRQSIPQEHDFSSDNSAELHLSSNKKDYRYVISLYRCNPSQHFSAQERSSLHNFSHLLLPLVEKHISTIRQPARRREEPVFDLDGQYHRGIESLRQRFDLRLSQSGLKLSSRETEICVGLLAGLTGPELAKHLGLGVNTVESYLKRAAIKMGISGRHSLIRWMHACERTAG
ncbi:helix-turn-helix transcriptional regulator [Pseudomonas sp. COR18]|uniref:helix-turn-helix transcriptional regulator n=1 Tax=Pseudomonas sp. COR18 TaxID=3399680 RepID=UPI003AFFDCA1